MNDCRLLLLHKRFCLQMFSCYGTDVFIADESVRKIKSLLYLPPPLLPLSSWHLWALA